MDVREKLVELIRNAKSAMFAENLNCDIAKNYFIAEFLIANGVTVQDGEDNDVPTKWISVKDRLPENDHSIFLKERKHYLVHLKNGQMLVAKYGYKEHDWWIDSHDCVVEKNRYREVIHWMPLPEPPKGD